METLNEIEEEEELKEVENLHQMSEPATSKEHVWRQEGPMLVCRKCDAPHSFWIGTHRRMTGLDKKGNPTIEKI